MQNFNRFKECNLKKFVICLDISTVQFVHCLFIYDGRVVSAEEFCGDIQRYLKFYQRETS